MLARIASDFETLLEGLRAGLSVSQAEVKAGFPAGSVEKWRTDDLGPKLKRDMGRLDACLQVRAGLAALDPTTTKEQEQNDVSPVKTSQRRARRQQATPIVKGDAHAHYWDIPPSGGAPEGTCRLCGETRLFSNTSDVEDTIDYRCRTREAEAVEAGEAEW